jgi:hypothetical protein
LPHRLFAQSMEIQVVFAALPGYGAKDGH